MPPCVKLTVNAVLGFLAGAAIGHNTDHALMTDGAEVAAAVVLATMVKLHLQARKRRRYQRSPTIVRMDEYQRKGAA